MRAGDYTEAAAHQRQAREPPESSPKARRTCENTIKPIVFQRFQKVAPGGPRGPLPRRRERVQTNPRHSRRGPGASQDNPGVLREPPGAAREPRGCPGSAPESCPWSAQGSPNGREYIKKNSFLTFSKVIPGTRRGALRGAGSDSRPARDAPGTPRKLSGTSPGASRTPRDVPGVPQRPAREPPEVRPRFDQGAKTV